MQASIMYLHRFLMVTPASSEWKNPKQWRDCDWKPSTEETFTCLSLELLPDPGFLQQQCMHQSSCRAGLQPSLAWASCSEQRADKRAWDKQAWEKQVLHHTLFLKKCSIKRHSSHGRGCFLWAFPSDHQSIHILECFPFPSKRSLSLVLTVCLESLV